MLVAEYTHCGLNSRQQKALIVKQDLVIFDHPPTNVLLLLNHHSDLFSGLSILPPPFPPTKNSNATIIIFSQYYLGIKLLLIFTLIHYLHYFIVYHLQFTT